MIHTLEMPKTHSDIHIFMHVLNFIRITKNTYLA